MKSLGCGGLIIVVAAIVALAALISGVVFYLIWNDFVIQHLAGAHRTSFGAAMLVGLGIGALAGGSSASNSK